MKHWKVTIKEVGNATPVVSEHYGELTYSEVKAFYGCAESDVEWYTIEQEEE